MLKIVEMSHLFSKLHIESLHKEELIIVDATCGAGNDTIFLASLVKENGHVYSYDIQEEALEITNNKLTELAITNVTLKLMSHVNITEKIIDLVIFNLGYFPNHDKCLTTCAETTMEALKNLLEKMNNNHDMLIIIVCYPGHEEGYRESTLIDEYLYNLPSSEYLVSKYLNYNRPSSPYLLTIKKTR